MTFHGKDFSKVLKYMYTPGDRDTAKSKPSHSMVVSPLLGPEGTRPERPRSKEELAKIAAYFCVENKKCYTSTSGNSNMSESRLKQIADTFCVESQEQVVRRRLGLNGHRDEIFLESRHDEIASMFCVESPEQAEIRRQSTSIAGGVCINFQTELKTNKPKNKSFMQSLLRFLIGQ